MFSHVNDSEAQQSHEEIAKGSPIVTAAVWCDRPTGMQHPSSSLLARALQGSQNLTHGHANPLLKN